MDGTNGTHLGRAASKHVEQGRNLRSEEGSPVRRNGLEDNLQSPLCRNGPFCICLSNPFGLEQWNISSNGPSMSGTPANCSSIPGVSNCSSANDISVSLAEEQFVTPSSGASAFLHRLMWGPSCSLLANTMPQNWHGCDCMISLHFLKIRKNSYDTRWVKYFHPPGIMSEAIKSSGFFACEACASRCE